jgi:hypothetical protein
MFDEIRIKYFHPDLKLGFQDIRNVLLMDTAPVKLASSLHRGNLVFRMNVSGKSGKKGNYEVKDCRDFLKF